MDERNSALASRLVDQAYVRQGRQSLAQRSRLLRELLACRTVPARGWDEMDVERLLLELSAMDSNNFIGSLGLGEREGRVACPLVRRRHFGLAHGIGRSGDVAAVQPKAAGSSLLVKLANALVLDAVRGCGVRRAASALVLPVATGMAVTMALLTLRAARPAARYVVWPRIDQKACFKAILTAGLEPLVVPLRQSSSGPGQLASSADDIEAAVRGAPGGPASVLCVLTTTSCFAPRAPDDVVAVARLCGNLDVPHVINNAYGLQASGICHSVNEAMRGAQSWCEASAAAPSPPQEGAALPAAAGTAARPPCSEGRRADDSAPAAAAGAGAQAAARPPRVDMVVQSTDKNFAVPVGGSIVFSTSPEAVRSVAQMYPGRASASPVVDIFATLLYQGAAGLAAARAQRKAVHAHLLRALTAWAERHGEAVISAPRNPISIAVTLGAICGGGAAEGAEGATKRATLFGSVLFARGVSGCRVVAPGATKSIGPVRFLGWGAQCDDFPCPYFTAAAAVGLREEDVDAFVSKLDVAVRDYQRLVRRERAQPAASERPAAEEAAVAAGGAAQAVAAALVTEGSS